MNINSDDFLKKITHMQEELTHAQQDIGSLEAIGESGAGLVKVTVNGQYMVVPRGIVISPSLIENKETREIIEQMMTSAVNEAMKKVQELSKTKLSEYAGRLSERITKNLHKGED